MTVQEILNQGINRLSLPGGGAFIDTPRLDAALLLAEILQMRREDMILRMDDHVCCQGREKFSALVERRRRGECVAYILGRKEFFGLDFAVNRNVLVPRPDTEILAEAAIECIDRAQANEKNISLLDLCTGSGVLAVSLKNERSFLSVTASDISSEALEVAFKNAAEILGRENAVSFIHSDLFENIHSKYNIIVSNPPYIPSDMMPALASEIQLEPKLSLDGGSRGLEIIERIVKDARFRLLSGGSLLLEAAPDQMPEIHAMLKNHGFANIKTRKDLSGMERVISCSSV